MFKFNLECHGCFLKQGLRHARNFELHEDLKREFVHNLLFELNSVKKKPPTPVRIGARIIYRKLSEYLQDEDPFRLLKEISNNEALKLYERLKDILFDPKSIESKVNLQQDDDDDEREKRLLLGMKLAAIGNTIDFGGMHTPDYETLTTEVENIPKRTFGRRKDYDRFKKQLRNGRSLMYIGDNCGEIVFDKVFIEFLLSEYKNIEKIYFVCRGRPIINDITMEDCELVGLTKFPKVECLPSTDPKREDKMAYPGTILDECTSEFMDLWKSVDVILSKGQGNFETMLGYDDKKNLYFLLKAKCIAIAEVLDVELLSLVFTSPFKNYNKVNSMEW